MAKLVIAVIALVCGGWMIFDGFHVLIKGKYFGPNIPGPWRHIVMAVGLDPFKLGAPFIVLGSFWILSLIGILLNQKWAWLAAMVTAISTLWFLPVGTILSLIYIALLIVSKSKLIS